MTSEENTESGQGRPQDTCSEGAAGDVQGFRALAALCVGLVIAADFLFWKQPVGWTLGFYGLLLTAAVFLWERGLPRGKPALFIAAGLAVLFLSCVEEPGSLTVVLGLLGLVTLALTFREGWSANGLVWTERWALFAGTGWLSFFREAARLRQRKREGEKSCRRLRVIRRWFLPALLSSVFLALFAEANPVISDWLRRLWRSLADAAEALPPFGRVIMWVLVGVWVWALLRFRSKFHDSSQERPAAGNTAERGIFSPGSIVRCLLLFNALFAV